MLNWEDDEVGPTLKAILQTAAHEPTTRDKLRKLIEQGLMGPHRSATATPTGSCAAA